MSDSELRNRLAAIEARLAAIERRQGLQSVPPVRVDTPPLATPAVAPAVIPPVNPPVNPPVIPPVAPPAPSAASATDTATPAGLERFLGVQVAAWIGAIVVIAAIGIFAKFAVDQGWFAKTPPAVKLALAYALSGAFVVAGSLLRDRLGRLPSASMLAAGVGGLFVSTCAGVTPLNILGPVTALVVGVATAIVGGALTLRARELTVGAISLLGAYIVPVFVGIYRPPVGADEALLLTGALYLTGIYGVALALARLGPAEFRWLRLAGALQAMSAVVLLIDAGANSPTISLAFTALWWAMAVAECTLAAMHGVSPRFNTAVTVAATSIGATLALRGAFATNPWADIRSWLPLGMAIAAGSVAGYLRGLVPSGGADDGDHEEDAEAFLVAAACARQSMVLAVLAGALVIAQVGVVVRGGALPVTWAIMGAAAILIGRRLGQMATARLGVTSTLLGLVATVGHAVLWGPGAAALLEYPADPSLSELSAWSFRFADTHWTPLIVAFALLFAARFWSIGTDRERRPPLTSGFLAACAALRWIGLSLAIASSYATTLLLLAIPAAALLAGRTLSLVKLIALLGSTIAALSWFAATLLFIANNRAGGDARPNGGAIAAAFVVGGYLMLGRRFRGERFGEIPPVIGFGFGLAALAMLVLIERLAGPTDANITAAVAWAAMAVAAVATVATFAARASKLQLSEHFGFVVTGLSLAVLLFAAIADAMQPAAGAAWLWHWLLTPINLGLVVLALCGFALRGLLSRGGPTAGRVAHGGLAVGAATGLLIGSTALVARFFDPRVGAPFETTRTIQQSALSVWLAIAAVLFVVYGFKRRTRPARWTGLVLLGLVALKVLVLDMSGAETIWRIAALLVTGLLLVATSTVYTRASKATAKPDLPPAPPQ